MVVPVMARTRTRMAWLSSQVVQMRPWESRAIVTVSGAPAVMSVGPDNMLQEEAPP